MSCRTHLGADKVGEEVVGVELVLGGRLRVDDGDVGVDGDGPVHRPLNAALYAHSFMHAVHAVSCIHAQWVCRHMRRPCYAISDTLHAMH